MKDDKKKKNAKKKFQDGLQELSKLTPEDRMDVYEELLGKDGKASRNIRLLGMQNVVFSNVAFREFRRKDAEISKDGYVVMRKPRVFLSHSHDDKRMARGIYQRLSNFGIKVWFDEAELRFGDSLIEKLRTAIDSVDILLALISKNSVDSEWVKKEIEIAMNQEIANRRVKVIPLLCAPIDLPGFLVGKLYADFKSADARKKNFPKLIADVQAHLEERNG
jgi:hypothetical protein